MYSTDAILIRTTRLTETSLIVHWFTEDEGLVKTVAKGALRPKSQFAGKLDLFFSGEISVVVAKSGDLHILKEVSISNWRQGLRRNYWAALMGGYFCQLVERSFEPGISDVAIHDLLRRGLDHLEKDEPSMRALEHFEKSLAMMLGVLGGATSGEMALRAHLDILPASRRELSGRLSES